MSDTAKPESDHDYTADTGRDSEGYTGSPRLKANKRKPANPQQRDINAPLSPPKKLRSTASESAVKEQQPVRSSARTRSNRKEDIPPEPTPPSPTKVKKESPPEKVIVIEASSEVKISAPERPESPNKRQRKPNPKYLDVAAEVVIDNSSSMSPERPSKRQKKAVRPPTPEPSPPPSPPPPPKKHAGRSSKRNKKGSFKVAAAERLAIARSRSRKASKAAGKKIKPSLKCKIIRTGKKRKAKYVEPETDSVRVYLTGDQIMVTDKKGDEVVTYRYEENFRGDEDNTKASSFICTICSVEFAIEANLEHHLMKEHSVDIEDEKLKKSNAKVAEEQDKEDEDEESYKTIGFKTLQTMLNPSTTKVTFNCDNCNVKFRSLKLLEKHSTKNCEEEHSYIHKGGIYQCGLCPLTFKYKSLLKIHSYSHTGEKPYKCEYCNLQYAQPGNLNKHMAQHHDDIPVRKIYGGYKCSDCMRKFSTEDEYEDHLRMKKERCHWCQRSFACSCLLYQHYLNDHEEYKDFVKGPNICKYCGKGFTYAAQLQVHERTHTGQKPYSCQYCQKSFTQKGNLSVHMQRHIAGSQQIGRFTCNYCGKKFQMRPHLDVHLRIHKGIRPFSCDICGKAFTQQGNLNVHRKIHTGQKDHRCSECGKCFAHDPQLRVHMRIHTGIRPYICQICNKTFTQAGNLTVHMKTVHNPNKVRKVRSHRRPMPGPVIRHSRPVLGRGVLNDELSEEDDDDDDLDESDDDVEEDTAEETEGEMSAMEDSPVKQSSVIEEGTVANYYVPMYIPGDRNPQPGSEIVIATESGEQQIYSVVSATEEPEEEDEQVYQPMTALTKQERLEEDERIYEVDSVISAADVKQENRIFELRSVGGSLKLISTDPTTHQQSVYIEGSDPGVMYEVVVANN